MKKLKNTKLSLIISAILCLALIVIYYLVSSAQNTLLLEMYQAEIDRNDAEIIESTDSSKVKITLDKQTLAYGEELKYTIENLHTGDYYSNVVIERINEDGSYLPLRKIICGCNVFCNLLPPSPEKAPYEKNYSNKLTSRWCKETRNNTEYYEEEKSIQAPRGNYRIVLEISTENEQKEYYFKQFQII